MRIVYTALLMFLAAAIHANPASWPRPIVEDEGLAARRELLLSHGVAPLPVELVGFLNEGFPVGRLPGGLPAEPYMKLEVVNAAVEELGVTGADEGVPVLIRLVERDLPEAIERIIRRDFEVVPVEQRSSQMALARQLLALNSITALGLIGDERAAPAVLDAMRREEPTGFITKGALALGQMGRNDGLPSLILLASDVTSDDSVAAFETIYFLTGQYYGYSRQSSIAKRRELVAQLRDWFESEGKDLPVYRAEVVRRRMNPVVPDLVDPRSLRGILRASLDLTNYDRRWTAREELERIAPSQFSQLKAICEDTFEDLDIRRAAMIWLSAANPRDARPVIRRLQRDENQVIARFAESLVVDIDEAIAHERTRRN